ncbi:MAG: hypothetical protein GWP10_07985 [Nitrospiraceae bacterium]|nr:hypothetical protein [Nitrospiraceae bacterium]
MKRVNLNIYPKRAREVALKLKEIYEKNGLFGHRELPDDMLNAYRNKLSTEELINMISLSVSIDYMRDAKKLWEASIGTALDKKANWVFDPNEVAESREEVLEKTLSSQKIAIRRERDTRIWFTICKTISKRFNGSFVKLFKSYNYDTARMLNELDKKDFPNLSGEKIFPYWIRILREKVKLPFKNLGLLPIPADVHVVRATFTTGCIRGIYSAKSITQTAKRRVIAVWEDGLKGTGIMPIDMFRPLWLLSKYGCHYREGKKRPKFKDCPINDLCIPGIVSISGSHMQIKT